MRKFILLQTSLFAVFFISASPAVAQNVLWVSNTGSDSNTCGASSPCGTFQGAINKGNVVQINCLTSGTYGGVTITSSLTIDCGTGNIGDVNVFSGNAITISTSSAATIVLRHLNVNGLGNNSSMVGVDAGDSFFGGTLIVEDCMIHGFHDGFGISFAPTGGRGYLQVSNTQIFDDFGGIIVFPGPGKIATVSLNKIEASVNFGYGVSLGGGVVAGTMRDSVVSGNAEAGLYAGADQVFFTVEESSIIGNLTNGIQVVSAGAIVNVAASTIGGNGTGVLATAGSIISFGDNHMSANGSNGTFTSTVPLR